MSGNDDNFLSKSSFNNIKGWIQQNFDNIPQDFNIDYYLQGAMKKVNSSMPDRTYREKGQKSVELVKKKLNEHINATIKESKENKIQDNKMDSDQMQKRMDEIMKERNNIEPGKQVDDVPQFTEVPQQQPQAQPQPQLQPQPQESATNESRVSPRHQKVDNPIHETLIADCSDTGEFTMNAQRKIHSVRIDRLYNDDLQEPLLGVLIQDESEFYLYKHSDGWYYQCDEQSKDIETTEEVNIRVFSLTKHEVVELENPLYITMLVQ